MVDLLKLNFSFSQGFSSQIHSTLKGPKNDIEKKSARRNKNLISKNLRPEPDDEFQ